MNKSNLINALSAKENLTGKNAYEIINLTFDGLPMHSKRVAELKSGDSGASQSGSTVVIREEIQRPVRRQRWERRSCPFSRLGRN